VLLCILQITLASAWPGLANGSRSDLRSVRTAYYTERVQYLEPQSEVIFRHIVSS